MPVRETSLNELLIEFAGTLCTDFSVQDILDHLVLRIVDLLPITGAGVMVVDEGDELHFIAASDDVVRQIEVVQRDLDEGPCHRAFATGRPVALTDLATDSAFPTFSARARKVGMAAVFTFPLHADVYRLGALDLYRDTAGPLSEEDVATATVLADVAAAYLMNARARTTSSVLMEDLNHRSLHDPLTGLPNRTLLSELLVEALARSRRTRRRTAVVFLDLDGFKAVNDRWGHRVGDLLLIAVAARLTAALRPGDLLARLGGDEFVAVCEDLPDGSRAADVAHRLLAATSTPFQVEGIEVEIGTSIGVALSDRRNPVGASGLLEQADAAMYRAKRDGGGRHVLHEPGDGLLVRRLSGPGAGAGTPASAVVARPSTGRWPADPDAGRDHVSTAYQPIVTLTPRRVTAVEALLRWQQPGPATSLPSTLVGEAERSGAILGLGEWVLRRACRDSLRWSGAQGPRTSVNVSAQQVTGPAFVRTVETVLRETGARPGSICLELTESATLPEDRRTVDVLRGLKELGVGLWLDDFGSGYSSLNYLRVFPVDAVKIDPSFAGRLPVEKASRAIVGSVVELCHALGMTVTVEGVETEAELTAVEDLGADAVQGFHISRPLLAAEVAGFAFPG